MFKEFTMKQKMLDVFNHITNDFQYFEKCGAKEIKIYIITTSIL